MDLCRISVSLTSQPCLLPLGGVLIGLRGHHAFDQVVLKLDQRLVGLRLSQSVDALGEYRHVGTLLGVRHRVLNVERFAIQEQGRSAYTLGCAHGRVEGYECTASFKWRRSSSRLRSGKGGIATVEWQYRVRIA